jgi:hypothetical protein
MRGLFRFAAQEKGLHISSNGVSVKTNLVKVSREEEVVSLAVARSAEVDGAPSPLTRFHFPLS